MKTTIKDGKLVIELSLQTPAPSKSGKTLIVASTHGCIATAATVEGKPVTVSINAFIAK